MSARSASREPGRRDVADRVGLRHVVGIVGSHQHVVGTVRRDEVLQVSRRVNDRIEVELPQVGVGFSSMQIRQSERAPWAWSMRPA